MCKNTFYLQITEHILLMCHDTHYVCSMYAMDQCVRNTFYLQITEHILLMCPDTHYVCNMYAMDQCVRNTFYLQMTEHILLMCPDTHYVYLNDETCDIHICETYMYVHIYVHISQ